MFGLGFSEILFIAIIAIIFLGPDKLPDAMVQIAKVFNNIKKSVTDAKSSIESELQMHDLREDAMTYKRNINNDIQGFKNAMIDPIDELEDELDDHIDEPSDITSQDNIRQDKPKSLEAPKKKSNKKKKKPKKENAKKSTQKSSNKKKDNK